MGTTLIWRLNSLPISAAPKSARIQKEVFRRKSRWTSARREPEAGLRGQGPIEELDDNHRKPRLESSMTAL
jgi:hypothetical protein